MILVDANLLLYAYHPRAEQHKASRAWLETTLRGLMSSHRPQTPKDIIARLTTVPSWRRDTLHRARLRRKYDG